MKKKKRVDNFSNENPELFAEFPLLENNYTKAECHRTIRAAGIELPTMYKLGYKNNNCIGCVKGQSGYWNKIRKDFPEAFSKMARMERELKAAINKKETNRVCELCNGTGVDLGNNCIMCNGKGRIRTREKVFLDELSPDAGRNQPEPDIECGVLCINENVESDVSEKPFVFTRG